MAFLRAHWKTILTAFVGLLAVVAGAAARWDVVARYGVRQKMALGTDGYFHYVSCAEYLLRGEGFKTAYNETPRDPKPPYAITPPLQPLFIAAVFGLAGDQSLMRVYAVQGFIGVLTGLFVFLILYSWRGRLAALSGLWIWMLYPEFVYWARLPVTENNYFFLMILMLWALVAWAHRPTAARAALAALTIGLANLQRAAALDLGLACLPLVLMLVRPLRRAWLQAACFAFIPHLILLPWMLYNLHRSGDPVWTGSNGGIILYASNHPGYDPIAHPAYQQYPMKNWLLPEIENRFWGPEMANHRTQYWMSKQYEHAFMNYVRTHPGEFLKNLGIKLVQRFVLFPNVKMTVGMVYFPWMYFQAWKFAIMFYGLLVLGLAGVIASLRSLRHPTRLVLTWSFGYFTFFAALCTWDDDGRYVLPLQVFLMFFAAVTLQRLVNFFLPPAPPPPPEASPCASPPAIDII